MITITQNIVKCGIEIRTKFDFVTKILIDDRSNAVRIYIKLVIL